ncbi:hypothetical protein, partial [Ruminococcus callidus]|uniref:hypothetical protein n=1 Tax=Ruminococcus callidus TaxID=40519 RepID=UPI003C6DC31A
ILPRTQSYGKGFLNNMAENLHADCVQSRQAGFMQGFHVLSTFHCGKQKSLSGQGQTFLCGIVHAHISPDNRIDCGNAERVHINALTGG